MSAIVQFTMELTGPYKGKSVKLNHLIFKNGRATVRGAASEIAGIIKYFKKSYAINIVGEENHGASEVHPTSQNRETDEVPSKIRQARTKSEEEGSVQLRGNDDVDGRDSRSVPSGNGHQDTRVSKEVQYQDSANKQVDPEKLLEVLKGLDPQNEAHWNMAGFPKLAVVSELYGHEGLTRKDLESVWPECNRKNTK